MIVYSNDVFKRSGELFQIEGSIIPTAMLAALPSGILSVCIMYWIKEMETAEEMRDKVAFESLRASQLWGAMFGALTFLVGFRTNKAYQRFWDGTTLLNQMWGEWFDAASCLFAFSHLARHTKPVEVAGFRHTFIRLMSLMHASALEEISQTDFSSGGYKVLDLGGLDIPSLKWLKDCKFDKELRFNRVEVLIHMIQNLIVENHDSGVLKIPPPILSRVFQTISRGQVNLANCKKITMTLFPFPYAQLIKFLLILLSVLTPIVMAKILESFHWAFVFTVVPIFGLSSLNLIAKELEIPFGKDANDLPLEDFHLRMNTSMLMLIRNESDLVPHITEFAEVDYRELKDKISEQRPIDFLKDLEEKHTASLMAKLANDPSSRPEAKTEAKKDMDPSILGKSPEAVVPKQGAVPPPQPLPLSKISVTAESAAVAVLPADSKDIHKVLDTVMHTKLEQLSNALDGLMANTKDFSSLMSQNRDAFQDLKTHTGVFSKQFVQSSQVMADFTKDLKAEGSRSSGAISSNIEGRPGSGLPSSSKRSPGSSSL